MFKNVAGSTKRHAQPNGSTGCQRGACWAAWLGRQQLGRRPCLYLTMQHAHDYAILQQHKGQCSGFSRMSSPFALSVNSSSWAEWTEALTASQHNTHTRPRIHRLHSAPCVEMAPSHSIQYGNGHIVLQGPLKSLSRSLSCRRKELPLLHTGCSPLPRPPLPSLD